MALGAEPLRLAYMQTELSRDGPGLLLRDITRGADDISAVLDTLTEVAPDVLVLGGIDHDFGGYTAQAVSAALATRGLRLPHIFTGPPNVGRRSGLDLDQDGQLNGPGDSQGWGRFPGAGGVVILSRYPIGAVQDYSAMAWLDLPDPQRPMRAFGQAFYPDALWPKLRLSTTVHWIAPILLPDTHPLTLMVLAATTPVFDGAEDRNGLRNADELALWRAHLDGFRWGEDPTPKGAHVAVLGTLNLDPSDGQGRREAVRALLTHPRLQDPEPRSEGGTFRAKTDGRANLHHAGDPALDTADFWDARANDPGNLRVDYVLPDARIDVIDAGLTWPETGRRAVVWVDIQP